MAFFMLRMPGYIINILYPASVDRYGRYTLDLNLGLWDLTSGS